MENLLVVANLSSPIIRASGYMTLDAILAAAIAPEYQPDTSVIPLIPITSSGGLFHASAAILEPIHAAHYAITGSMRAEDQITLSNIKLNRDGNIHADPFVPAYKPVMNSYIAITSLTAKWIVSGDRSSIERLLDSVEFIGKRRNSGYGQVSNWTVTPTDLSPLMDDGGNPLRPIPVSMFKGNRSNPIQDVAWCPPYWNPMNRAPCFAPSLVIA